eukprot:g31473.t1
MELEDERQSFLDEGVYDVVNSICGQTGLSPRENGKCLMGNAKNSPKNGGGTVTYHIGSTDLPAEHPLTFCGSPVATSPMSVAQILARRSEQDLRSAELSGENEKLRRELERTTKILEVLEQQKHLAEDKMLALEQEHAKLLRRLAQAQAAGKHGTSALCMDALLFATGNEVGRGVAEHFCCSQRRPSPPSEQHMAKLLTYKVECYCDAVESRRKSLAAVDGFYRELMVCQWRIEAIEAQQRALQTPEALHLQKLLN